jgi:hypothetical protein
MAPLVRDAIAALEMKKIPWHNQIIPAPAYRSMGPAERPIKDSALRPSP